MNLLLASLLRRKPAETQPEEEPLCETKWALSPTEAGVWSIRTGDGALVAEGEIGVSDASTIDQSPPEGWWRSGNGRFTRINSLTDNHLGNIWKMAVDGRINWSWQHKRTRRHLHDEIQKRQLVTRLLHWELHNKEKDWP